MKKYKAIFHVVETGKIRIALANMNNLFNDLGEDQVEVAFVGNSDGLATLYQDSEYKEEVEKLFARGVYFAACANMLKAKELSQADLLGFAEVVPSGVGELVKKQSEGYCYIRP